jgi:hypothetical protein
MPKQPNGDGNEDSVFVGITLSPQSPAGPKTHPKLVNVLLCLGWRSKTSPLRRPDPKVVCLLRPSPSRRTHPAFIVLMPKSFVHSFYAMPRKSNTKWTDEDDRRLLELRAAGKSERVIALALRRSPGSVGTRLSTLRARSHAGLTTEVVLELDQP